jgi:lipopolysaccharide transport protein LptA
MAHSPPCRKALLLASALAVTTVAAPPVGAADAAAPLASPASQLPINVDASKAEIDARTNTLAYTDVTISQGTMRVQADHAHASGLSFANSRWTFEGHVRISAEERGNLRSDLATVDFRDNHIARATITGRPAQFEQKRTDTDQVARGHADEIVYDLSDGTVRLSDDAWLTDGQSEISGPLLVYNVRAQHIEAATTPGNNQRIHIIIPASGKIGTLPGDKSEAARPAPTPAPQP